jgi:hypothetical protein
MTIHHSRFHILIGGFKSSGMWHCDGWVVLTILKACFKISGTTHRAKLCHILEDLKLKLNICIVSTCNCIPYCRKGIELNTVALGSQPVHTHQSTNLAGCTWTAITLITFTPSKGKTRKKGPFLEISTPLVATVLAPVPAPCNYDWPTPSNRPVGQMHHLHSHYFSISLLELTPWRWRQDILLKCSAFNDYTLQKSKRRPM